MYQCIAVRGTHVSAASPSVHCPKSVFAFSLDIKLMKKYDNLALNKYLLGNKQINVFPHWTGGLKSWSGGSVGLFAQADKKIIRLKSKIRH